MRRTDPEHSQRRYFRAQDRVFSQNGLWYFTAREGDVGPFPTRETALKEVARYAKERYDLERFQQDRERQNRSSGFFSLAIVPKDEELDLSLDDLILENQH